MNTRNPSIISSVRRIYARAIGKRVGRMFISQMQKVQNFCEWKESSDYLYTAFETKKTTWLVYL